MINWADICMKIWTPNFNHFDQMVQNSSVRHRWFFSTPSNTKGFLSHPSVNRRSMFPLVLILDITFSHCPTRNHAFYNNRTVMRRADSLEPARWIRRRLPRLHCLCSGWGLWFGRRRALSWSLPDFWVLESCVALTFLLLSPHFPSFSFAPIPNLHDNLKRFQHGGRVTNDNDTKELEIPQYNVTSNIPTFTCVDKY